MVRNNISELFAKWPTRQDAANAIGASLDQVHKWAQSGRVPSGWQKATVDAAQKKGLSEIDANWMIAAHARTS